MDGIADGYLTLLGLISHEYFHTWNVKRLKPADLASIDWQRENHTELLWFFEGFTSYYDELMLQRCGLIDGHRYLKLLAKTVNAVVTTPGRAVQSVAAASFDAWVKYYRTDENTPNSTVSYYLKGALVALCLDLTLRQHGRSLDALMRTLWQRSGGGPVTEADIADALAELAGGRLDAELRNWVHGTGELPVTELLNATGVAVRPERTGFGASLGLRLSEGPVSGVQVKSVLAGSAAAAAGVSAGDELLAVDGWRIRRLDDALTWLRPGVPFDLLLVRDQRVLTLAVQPQPDGPLASSLVLQLQDSPPKAAAARRRAWLGV
jgi:predicted metalloprotease with PDZ domain